MSLTDFSNKSNRYIFSTCDINLAVFRYWQTKPRKVLEVLYYDTALGKFLCEGSIREALKPGHDIVNKDGKAIHEDISKRRLKTIEEIYIKAKAAKRAFSHAVLIYTKFGDADENQWYWLEDTHINHMVVKPGTKEIIEFKFTNPLEDPTTTADPIEVKGDALKNLRLLGDFDVKMGKYRSWLEPIYDELIGITQLLQQLTILVIRIASGIREIKASAQSLKDPATKKAYEDLLENMGMNILLGVPLNDEGFEFNLHFGEGSNPIDFPSALDTLLVPVSIHSGYPKEALKGNELGLRSAETNRQQALNTMTNEQDDSNEDLLWMYGIDEVLNIDIDDTDDLKWKPLVEVDETEKVTVEGLKFGIVQKLLPDLNLLGMSLEDLYSKLNIDMEIDDTLRQKTITENQALKAKIQEGISEGTKEGNESDKGNGNGSDEGKDPDDTELQSKPPGKED